MFSQNEVGSAELILEDKELTTKPSLKMLIKNPHAYFVRFRAYRNQKYYEAQSAEKKDPSKAEIGAYSAWDNSFPNFVMGELFFIRTIVSEPLIPNIGMQPIIPPQQDAFWTMNQVSQWFDNTIPSWLKYPFDKIGDGVNWVLQQKSIAAALTYVPFIGLGVHAILTIKDFYYEKNKNIYNTLKMIADVASSVLLAVGLGLIQWGTIAAAVYCAPYLIMAAAALVVSVGLVRSFHHIYQAYLDPANCRQHLVNAFKEFLCTFINAAGFVLTLFGMQAGQKLQQFDIQKFNFQVLIDAGEIYKKTVILTNTVLAAVATLFVMKVVPILYRGLKYIGSKINHLLGIKEIQPKKAEFPLIQNSLEKNNLVKDINNQLKKLNSEIETSQSSNGYISKKLNERRKEKIEYLTQIKTTLEDEKIKNPHSVLVHIEKAEFSKGTSIYQSFFSVKGTTQELAERALEMTKAAAAPAA